MVIRTSGAIFIRAKVVGNFIMEVQITFHIFDLGKLERIHRADRGLGERSKRSGGRRKLDEGGGGRGAETTMGGAAPADGVQPNRVRSEAEEVEIFPRDKERSGETAGAVGDATDAGTCGCPPGGGGTP